jgi:hypothetical protein
METWFRSDRSCVTLKFSARTMIGPALQPGSETPVVNHRRLRLSAGVADGSYDFRPMGVLTAESIHEYNGYSLIVVMARRKRPGFRARARVRDHGVKKIEGYSPEGPWRAQSKTRNVAL